MQLSESFSDVAELRFSPSSEILPYQPDGYIRLLRFHSKSKCGTIGRAVAFSIARHFEHHRNDHRTSHAALKQSSRGQFLHPRARISLQLQYLNRARWHFLEDH